MRSAHPLRCQKEIHKMNLYDAMQSTKQADERAFEKIANARYEYLPINELKPHENLKEIDNELIDFMGEIMSTNINSGWAVPTVKHSLSYLDALCSLKFEILGKKDKKTIESVLNFIVKKSAERLHELTKGNKA